MGRTSRPGGTSTTDRTEGPLPVLDRDHEVMLDRPVAGLDITAGRRPHRRQVRTSLDVEADHRPIGVNHVGGRRRDRRQQRPGAGLWPSRRLKSASASYGAARLAVGEPVGEPDDPAPQRLEGHRHHDGGDARRPEPAVRPVLAEQPDDDHEADVADGDEGGRAASTTARLMISVDVVEPVAEHAPRRCRRAGRRTPGTAARSTTRSASAVDRLADDQAQQPEPDRRQRRPPASSAAVGVPRRANGAAAPPCRPRAPGRTAMISRKPPVSTIPVTAPTCSGSPRRSKPLGPIADQLPEAAGRTQRRRRHDPPPRRERQAARPARAGRSGSARSASWTTEDRGDPAGDAVPGRCFRVRRARRPRCRRTRDQGDGGRDTDDGEQPADRVPRVSETTITAPSTALPRTQR